jgi:hypothetical protein
MDDIFLLSIIIFAAVLGGIIGSRLGAAGS